METHRQTQTDRHRSHSACMIERERSIHWRLYRRTWGPGEWFRRGAIRNGRRRSGSHKCGPWTCVLSDYPGGVGVGVGGSGLSLYQIEQLHVSDGHLMTAAAGYHTQRSYNSILRIWRLRKVGYPASQPAFFCLDNFTTTATTTTSTIPNHPRRVLHSSTNTESCSEG